MKRRQVLVACGTLAVAGCSGASEGSSGASSGDGGGGNAGQSTDTAQPTTAEPTPEPTPTATATPSMPTHAVGESFVVGGGDRAIRYTVESVRATDHVGTDSFGEDADGRFLVVTLAMENTGTESFDISTRPFRMVDRENRAFDVDTDALVYLEDAIVFEQLDPGLTKQGVIVFDVAPDGQYALHIEPAGMFSTDVTHVVEFDV